MFKAFPKILTLRNLIGSMSREEGFQELGPLTFIGQPKVHGTNGALIIIDGLQPIRAQSRNRLLSLGSDNMGFASFAALNEEDLRYDLVELLEEDAGLLQDACIEPFPVHLYGEWAGPGVKRGVAVSSMKERRFFPFAVSYGDNPLRVVAPFEGKVLKTMADFGAERRVTFDPSTFEGYEEAYVAIQEATDEFEEECPVAAFYGHKGMGEGLVWTSTCGRFRFKSKGAKHQQVRKPLPTPLDPKEQELAKSFAHSVVTPARMEGAYAWMAEMGHPMDRASTGKIISYILDDVQAECIEEWKEVGIPWKPCAGHIATMARTMFFEELDK